LIIDRFGRQFRNLRLSLTAACNYACTYCVPDGKRLQAADHELSADHMLALVKLLVSVAGINKIRITGGEPLLSPKFDKLLGPLMGMGFSDLSLTTNGQLIPRKIDVIAASGIKRINVSLDTLDADYFRDIARSGDLKTVLSGIDLLQAAGIRVKINMVPMRGHNDQQILPMLEYCLARDIELRFIELMNMGHLKAGNGYRDQFFSMSEILDLISQQHSFSEADAPYDSTAVRYSVSGGGAFGIIANESAPFCGTCSRLRLSSNGHLYGCLSSAAFHDLTPLLQMSENFAVARLQKILNSALADKQTTSFRGETTVMKFIGG
jgi:cyclic pyranopterin phosphate synthase